MSWDSVPKSRIIVAEVDLVLSIIVGGAKVSCLRIVAVNI